MPSKESALALKESKKHSIYSGEVNVDYTKIREVLRRTGRNISSDLIKRMKELDMKTDGLEWYLDLRRFGGCKHAGFGVGFERLVMYVTGMQNIRDVIPFARTPKNLLF